MYRFRIFLSLGLVLGAVVGVQQAVAHTPGVAAHFGSSRLATACSPAGPGVVALANDSSVPVVFVLWAQGSTRTVTLAAHSRFGRATLVHRAPHPLLRDGRLNRSGLRASIGGWPSSRRSSTSPT
jgi:hypothetical protein